MAQGCFDRNHFQMAEVDSFEIGKAGQQSLTGASMSCGSGSSTTVVVDLFYESIDCPMFVDFTQPDSVREDDLQAWFEGYVDYEAGKPRSYPLFRDPTMDLALCELELEQLLEATKLLDALPPKRALETPPIELRRRSSLSSSSDSHPGRERSPDSVLRSSPFELHKAKGLLDVTRINRLKGLLKSDLRSSKAASPGGPLELRPILSISRAHGTSHDMVHETSKTPHLSDASGIIRARRALPVSRPLELGIKARKALPLNGILGREESSEAFPCTTGPPAVVLPKAVSLKKHSTLDASADASECSPAKYSTRLSPVSPAQRPSLRHPEAKSSMQGVCQKAAHRSEKQDETFSSEASQQPTIGHYRSGCDPQKVAERKARLREALHQREAAEAVWHQTAVPLHSQRARKSYIHERQQAPSVLALWPCS